MKFASGTFHGLEDREVEAFRKHLAGLEGVGVEIGCCDGYSTAHILEFSRLHLVSVDPMVSDPVEKHLIGSAQRLEQNLAPYKGRHTFMNMTSEKAICHFFGFINFLFIDGDHTKNGVELDFRLWVPRLVTGGLLAMHDCRMNRKDGAKFHLGPSRVADDRVFSKPSEWQIIDEAFSMLIAKKL
jgi:predicted O-methyltransferase YrrM